MGKSKYFFTWCTLDMHITCYLDNTTVEVKYEQHSYMLPFDNVILCSV